MSNMSVSDCIQKLIFNIDYESCSSKINQMWNCKSLNHVEIKWNNLIQNGL